MHSAIVRGAAMGAAVVFAVIAAPCSAAVTLESPKEGEVVSQLWPEQKEFLETPLGRATAAEAFSLLVNRKNYPIVFHCIGGTDRTGTFAYLLNGLLGVSEEELILDYDISFMGGQGPDARHRGWQSGLTKAARELPGDTLAEKFKRYFISLGFTEEEVEGVREFLLEPKQ